MFSKNIQIDILKFKNGKEKIIEKESFNFLKKINKKRQKRDFKKLKIIDEKKSRKLKLKKKKKSRSKKFKENCLGKILK